MARQLASSLLRIDSAHNREPVRPQAIHRVGVEADVRVDPHGLLEAVPQGVRGHLISSLIDGRIAADPADAVTAPFKLLETGLASRLDVAGDRNEHDALGIARGPPLLRVD